MDNLKFWKLTNAYKCMQYVGGSKPGQRPGTPFGNFFFQFHWIFGKKDNKKDLTLTGGTGQQFIVSGEGRVNSSLIAINFVGGGGINDSWFRGRMDQQFMVPR